MFDTSRLGAWADLPFFTDDLPAIADKLDGTAFLPPTALTFKALERTQPDAVKVVILGQDPYHTAGKADGLAFSIPDDFGGKLDSLGNIFKELHSDLDLDRSKTSLDDWADQGVLLLNTALTVPLGQAKAHAKIGWSKLVTQVLQNLGAKPRAFILWGGPAKAYALQITGPHLIHTSAHPSPLSCHRGFFGSRPFSTVNQWLIDSGNTPINWADPL
ncbi:uracil-DNA glycosylase [Loktanella ponticola]|uniref:Uracil-DNA glycosylase n=1 Tax=Yoonia ponticola TaxID=1524255 RepID=A0A7W9EZ85_9RHOB|nr:uracil-DNA glycosylase [Yoonia ponticola]MBB5721691.1 uracil-DNA glycosylase [Yoonia ponticola]